MSRVSVNVALVLWLTSFTYAQQNASFEVSAAGWLPKNLASAVNLLQYNPGNYGANYAHDGAGFLEMNTSTPGGSVAQDVPVPPLPGQSYSFSVWLRAAPGVNSVSGTVALWGLGGTPESGLTNFTVGPAWMLVTAPLDVQSAGHTGLRAEIYMQTTGANLDADGALLIDTHLQNASFESSAAGWLPKNLASAVNLLQYNPGNYGANYAHDGAGFLEMNTSTPGGSVAQDVPVPPLPGQSYSFSVWLRAAPGVNSVSGTVALWGLGGTPESGLTNFTVGPAWMLVTAPLDVQSAGHTSLRAEIYMQTTGANLDADGATLRQGFTLVSFNSGLLQEAHQAIDQEAAQAGLGQSASSLHQIEAYAFVQQFPNDVDVYWSPPTGGHEVQGEIKRKYDVTGGPRSFLGLPTTDEPRTLDGSGRFNHFQNGSIFWTSHTGPMIVSGAIRDKWATLGWEHGELGYPVTDQVRWRTVDGSVDQFIAWNLYENGAIVTTKNVTDVARTAHITPDQLAFLVHRAADTAVHKLPDNIGLYPDVQVTAISGWEYDFFASKSRAITFKLHGFHDNGLLPDTEFYFWFALRFSLSKDPMALSDPWFRSLQVELLPDSVGVSVQGIAGWFVSGDDYKQSIENAFNKPTSFGQFPVTTYLDATQPVPPDDQVDLIIIDILTTAAGGIDFLVTPEPPIPGLPGSWVPLIQKKIDDFVESF
jgi:hypothetical protein